MVAGQGLMMKKVLLVVTQKGEKKQYLVQRLSALLVGKVQFKLVNLSDFTIELNGKKVEVKVEGKSVSDFDLVYFRRVGGDFMPIAGSLAICFDSLRLNYIDSVFKEMGPARNKLSSLLKLSLSGLPVPPTFFCFKEHVLENIDYLAACFGFPLIAKEICSQRGQGVFLVKDKNDFSFLDEVAEEDQFLFQKFYPNDEEFRLLVLGDRVAVYERKVRADEKEFRNNVALGAREEFLDLNQTPRALKQIAIKAAKVLGYQITGVDVLVDKTDGKYWLLEANRGPGLTYDESVSPELSQLADYFTKKLRA